MERMRLACIVIYLSFLCSALAADELIFFADDHYKAVGWPLLNASVSRPLLDPDASTITVTLSNDGRLDELMLISSNGSKEDLEQEMLEEMHSVDAYNITARLYGAGPVQVDPGTQSLSVLPAGSVADLQFNLTVVDGADGWYELPLYLEYERQADVSVVDGIPSPLYLRENLSTGVTVLVQGAEGPLEVMGVSCDLHPGGSDLLVAAIKNRGRDQLHGCSARLVLFPPFSDEGAAVVLGDLLPGDVAVAGFPLSVDSGAAVQDYQLLLQLEYLEGRSMLSLPVSLSTSGRGLLLPIGAAVAVAALAALLAARWSRRPRRWRRTR